MRILINIILTCLFANFVYSQSEPFYFTKANSGLPSDTVTVVVIDKKGNKWIGTPKGLAKFDGKSWTKFDSTNSIITFPNPVLDIKVKNNDNVLVGCWGNSNGLNIYDGTNWKTINGGRGFMVIQSIAVDLKDNVWIGSNAWDGGTGLGKISGDSIKVYTEWEKSIPANDIRSIACDKNNTVWIASWRNSGLGITKFNEKKSITYTTDNSKLSSNNVTVITPDMNGSIWIGTQSSGINILKNEKWTKYSLANSQLPSDSITSIVEDHLGNVWIGTNGGGLAKFKSGVWTIYNSKNSIVPHQINSICTDETGNLWISSNKGLIRFNINQ